MGRVIRATRQAEAVVPGVIFDARKTAARIIEDAREQAAQLRERAVEQGLELGRVQAARALFDLAALREQTIDAAEQTAAQAALLIAKRLVGEACKTDTRHVVALIEAQLARVRRAKSIVVHVAPDDAPALREALDACARRLEIQGRVELREDPSITRGGCLVESNLGELDARVETRIDHFARALREPRQ